MQFVPGQVVIHPTTVLPGSSASPTESCAAALSIAVPLDSVEEVGLREPMCREELDDLFGVLTALSARQEKQWARRMKDEVQRFRTGDVLAIAGVVRDLIRRREEQGLSLGERDLLRDARRPLVSELVGCLRMGEEQCAAVVGEAVLQGSSLRCPWSWLRRYDRPVTVGRRPVGIDRHALGSPAKPASRAENASPSDTADSTILCVPSVVKILAQMRANPSNIRYEDLAKVCEHHFGPPRTSGGSHAVFKTLGPVTRG